MTRMFFIISLLVICIGFQSCKSEFKILHSNDFSKHSMNIDSLTIFPIEFKAIYINKKNDKPFNLNWCKKSIEQAAKRQDISLQWINDNSSESEYLKKELLLYLSLFNDSKNEQNNSIKNLVYKNGAVFDSKREIDLTFNTIKEKYSRYIGFIEISKIQTGIKANIPLLILFPPAGLISLFKSREETHYKFVITDIATGNIIYTETRKITGSPLKYKLESIIFDSFNITRNGNFEF